MRVSIILESNTLCLFQKFFYESVNSITTLTQFLLCQIKLLCESSANDSHRPSGVLRRTECSKLELVACVSKWTRSVPISVLLVKIFVEEKQLISEVLFYGSGVSINHSAHCLSQIRWDDSRRSLVTAQPDFVSRTSDRGEIEGVVPSDCWQS